jgi:polysaccharide biosynthesis/export protein
MKRFPYLVLFLMCAVLSCTTPKEIIYFQDIDEVSLKQLTTEYEAKIRKDDMLSIIVSGPDKQVVQPYNLTLSDNVGGGNVDPERTTLSYLVDSKGEIDFPILGKIKVEGMTRSELVDHLTKKIGKDVKNPIVHITFKNYKITILGEVRNPGTYTMASEKITILQALGSAGDLLISAERSNLLLIREVEGRQTYKKIDLRESAILESPYFYLQQNDVLYVPPSASRVATATTATGIWSIVLSSVTTLVAVLSLILANSK